MGNSHDMIALLRSVKAEKRAAIITELYDKNRFFFKKRVPAFDQLLESVECPYHFDVTSSFINIVHTPSDSLAHPDSGLDNFAEALALPNHKAWIDLVNCERTRPGNSPEHCRILDRFEQVMNSEFPDLSEMIEKGNVRVSTNAGKTRFSPPIVFSGIFHGLHIDRLLKTIRCNRVVLIEPEPERFEVSCYFLDYSKIYELYGFLPVNIGARIDKQILEHIHTSDKVTSRLWVRVLPGYDSEYTGNIIGQCAMHQQMLSGRTTSLDNEISGIVAGWNSIQSGKYRVLEQSPVLSKNAVIAVIASGPSLMAEYDWLRDNRENIIIFAVHSAVKPLRKQGIVPDFQFSIDMHLTKSNVEKLDLDKGIPLVCYYKSSQPVLDSSERSMLVAEKNITNPVKFRMPLTETHPSTATMALSFACLCKPSRILLIGLDLGFREMNRQAITGGIHDLRIPETENIYETVSNFSVDSNIFTNSFFNSIKDTVETIVNKSGHDIEFLNLSDGVKIKGVNGKRSRDLNLIQYSSRLHDIKAIEQAFGQSERGRNWDYYEIPGNELLELFKSQLKQKVVLQKWSFKHFSSIIDSVLKEAMETCISKSNCLRMTLYERLVIDLLTTWYLYLLLCPDTESAENVYNKGREIFIELIDSLVWPLENDQV